MASYTYGRVWYFDSDDVANSDQVFIGFNDDSVDQRAYVSLGTSDLENAATLKGFYEWQNSEFDTSQRYRYERAGLDTSLRLTRTLRLVADGGVETDLTETTTDGGLDSEFWHVGFRWQPDSRTSLDVRYGDRFFGESYSVDGRYEGRWLTLTGVVHRRIRRSRPGGWESISTRPVFRFRHRPISRRCRPPPTSATTRY